MSETRVLLLAHKFTRVPRVPWAPCEIENVNELCRRWEPALCELALLMQYYSLMRMSVSLIATSC